MRHGLKQSAMFCFQKSLFRAFGFKLDPRHSRLPTRRTASVGPRRSPPFCWRQAFGLTGGATSVWARCSRFKVGCFKRVIPVLRTGPRLTLSIHQPLACTPAVGVAGETRRISASRSTFHRSGGAWGKDQYLSRNRSQCFAGWTHLLAAYVRITGNKTLRIRRHEKHKG